MALCEGAAAAAAAISYVCAAISVVGDPSSFADLVCSPLPCALLQCALVL